MGDTSYFDAKATEWDTPDRRALANAVADSIIRSIPLDGEMTAMDYGAGTGLVTLRLQRLLKSVLAVDTSEEMLRVLREKADSAGARNVETFRYNALEDPPPDEQVDLVFSSMTLHHVANTAAVLRVFHEILAPGGAIALADLDTEEGDFHAPGADVKHNGFERQALKKLCREAGFKSVETDTAYRFYKTSSSGIEKEYTVFILTARK